MSDIHGNAARFNSIMKQIDLQPEDTLYVLGDVIDRYPDGIRILRLLMSMPNVKMILGNHEYMMLNAMDRFDERNQEHTHALRLWYRNGGMVTHNYLKHIRKEIRKEVFDYLHSLSLNIDVEVNGKSYILVHGGVVALYPEYKYRYDSVEEYAVWHRIHRNSPELEGKTIIFGHTPTSEYQQNNPLELWHSPKGGRIGIDCGCGFSGAKDQGEHPAYGRLACLRLDDMKVFYSIEGHDPNRGDLYEYRASGRSEAI